MDSRISVILNDRSARANPVVGVTGATVIDALKGPTKPILIDRGSTNRILSVFGIPTSNNRQVWDVIQYNNSYPLWVSAPTDGGKYGAVVVTKAGTKTKLAGITDPTAINFAEIPVAETTTTANQTVYTLTTDAYFRTHYVNQSMTVLVNGVATDIVFTDAATEVASGTGLSSGSYVRSTGVLTLTFSVAKAVTDVVSVVYETNLTNDAYFVLHSANPQADDLAVQIVEGDIVSTNFLNFDVSLYLKDLVNNTYSQLGSAVKVALVETAKDGFGRYIYGPTIMEGSDYLRMVVNPTLASGTIASNQFTEDTTRVDLTGGVRGTFDPEVAFTDYFNAQANTYTADIFFDVTGDATIPNLFATARDSYQKYSTYLLPTGNEPNGTNMITNLVTDRGSISNRGVKFYAGWAEVLNPYAAGTLATPLLGNVAKNHADMFVQFNGLQVSDTNENGLGGQLGLNIVRMFQDFSEADILALEAAQINPIIRHPSYGVMVMRDRTSLSGALSDYSYGGHSRLADYIIKNVITALVPQLSKPNDPTHRYLVSSRVGAIVNPLLASPFSLLRDALIICDETNNTDEVLSRSEFALDVLIKFTPFSNFIKFYFTNVSQTTNIQEVVGA